MSTNTLLETRTANFSDLLGNRKTYRVPTYQRDYSWESDNWEDLWEDIVKTREDRGIHYMGAIVLQISKDNDTITIIDGQQRFATLSILALAVIEKINQLVKTDIDPEDNKQRIEILKRTYIGDMDSVSLHYSSKLILNENDDDFYQGNLIRLRKPQSMRTLKKSEKLLWDAFVYFSKKLDFLPEVIKDGALLSKFLTNTVTQRLLFIQISVEDQVNAYVVFETLNSRGVDLSITDLLKNHLFSLVADSVNDLEVAQRDWRKIIKVVGMKNFPEFLRYFISMDGKRVRKNQLFRNIRQDIKDKKQVFEMLSQLMNLSELYVALSDSTDDYWSYHPTQIEVRKSIAELELFGSKQAYPALFAAWQKFDDQRFKKFLDAVMKISFRYTAIGGLATNELESQYNSLAKKIRDGNIKTPRAAFNAVSSLYVPDDKFRQDFAVISVSTKQNKKKKLVKYILSELEKYSSGRPVEDSCTIEHILPQQPTSLWRKGFSEEVIDDMIYRLGNMTPLEKTKNTAVGTEPYEVKKEKYEESIYSITKTIKSNEWNAHSIENRQKEMAKRAVDIWQIKY